MATRTERKAKWQPRALALARSAGERRNSAHEAAVTALLEAELKLDDGWRAARDRANAEFERMGMSGFVERALLAATRPE